MSGNFVRERQRIVYVYNIHVYYICKQYVAARARNFQTFWAAYGFTQAKNGHTHRLAILRMRNILASTKE